MALQDGFKLATDVRTSAYMDAVALFRDLPLPLPSAYQAGGHLYGLKPDIAWTDPALPHTYFVEAEDVVRAGDQNIILLGAPWAQWYVPVWTDGQLAYVRATYCPAPALSTIVTIRTWMAHLGQWGDWWGTLHFPIVGHDMTRVEGGWADVTLKFVGLRQAAAE